MTEDKKNNQQSSSKGHGKGQDGGRSKGRGAGRKGGKSREPREFDQHIVDLARVTRVTKGGKQLSFRATIIIGDRKGRVGYAVAKGKDVQIAVEKAVRQAKKILLSLHLTKDSSIPHITEAKFGGAKVMIKPAPKGSGLISGGAVRMMLELGGVDNASSKILNGGTKINIIRATYKALSQLSEPRKWQRKQKAKSAPDKKEGEEKKGEKKS